MVTCLLSIVMVFALVLPSQTEASENFVDVNTESDFSDVNTVMQHVSVNESGHAVLDSEYSKQFYELYDLDLLELHLDSLNEKVDAGIIKINKDLSITDLSVTTYASYSKWTYHVWGYDRNFNNKQAIVYANDLNGIASGLTMGGSALANLMPIVGAGVLVSAGYYGLLSSRVTANNKGKGVYVAMTWARIFNVKPL